MYVERKESHSISAMFYGIVLAFNFGNAVLRPGRLENTPLTLRLSKPALLYVCEQSEWSCFSLFAL